MVEAEEVDEGVDSAPLLYGLPVPPLHAHPPQHLCSYNTAVPALRNTTEVTTKLTMIQKQEAKRALLMLATVNADLSGCAFDPAQTLQKERREYKNTMR